MRATGSSRRSGRHRPGAATVSFTLGADVENLILTGGAAINGTGNDLANTLTGNAGANMLDGGSAPTP